MGSSEETQREPWRNRSALESSTYTASDTKRLGLVHDVLTADEALEPVPRYYLS